MTVIDGTKKLLKTLIPYCGQIELAYSGGKDSDVMLNLCREVGLDVTPVYHATTIDPPGTIKHCREVGAKIIKPAVTFFELIEKNGLPEDNRRFCCRKLKELPPLEGMKKLLVGVRKSESKKREKIYREPTECRIYGRRKIERIYPLLYWSDDDIKKYVESRNLKLHPDYYDELGNFDVTRRLGCIACPLSQKDMRKDFIRYPRFVREYIRRFKVYQQKHGGSFSTKDPYEVMYAHITGLNDVYDRSLFEFDARQVMEEFYKIRL
jgi:phosphoadenosine phosphosulfate reductase